MFLPEKRELELEELDDPLLAEFSVLAGKDAGTEVHPCEVMAVSSSRTRLRSADLLPEFEGESQAHAPRTQRDTTIRCHLRQSVGAYFQEPRDVHRALYFGAAGNGVLPGNRDRREPPKLTGRGAAPTPFELAWSPSSKGRPAVGTALSS